MRDLSEEKKCKTVPVLCYIEITKNPMNTIRTLVFQKIFSVSSAPHRDVYCTIQNVGFQRIAKGHHSRANDSEILSLPSAPPTPQKGTKRVQSRVEKSFSFRSCPHKT